MGQGQAGQSSQVERTYPEELFSIAMAVLATIFGPLFIWFTGSDAWVDPQRTGHLWWTVPVWIGLFYLIIQMVFLLQSASQIRALGVLDSVVSIFPLVAGLVLLALSVLDSSKFHFTNYQHNAISVLIVVSAAEFLLTIWIRFVVNRRTIGLGGGN
jgi:hypothetical protein